MQKLDRSTIGWQQCCERCGKELTLRVPLIACTIVENNTLSSGLLCRDCMTKLKTFLGGQELGDKNLHIPF